MKKTLKLTLLAVCILCLLCGCYEQNSVISVNPFGGIHTEMSFAGNDDGILEITGGATYDDLKASLIPQLQGMITDTSKEKLEEITVDVDGESYKGVKATGYFSSLSEMYSSEFFSVFNSYNMIPAPIASGDLAEGEPGVSFKEDKGFFGTTYKANGNINITQGNELDASQREAMSKSQIKIKFKFPVLSFTVSKGNKNIVKPTFEYVASTENDNVLVDFSVFVPNYLMILGILLIIGLIVAVVLMAKKIKELKKIIAGETEEEVVLQSSESFINEDDENFFEGSAESVEVEPKTVISEESKTVTDAEKEPAEEIKPTDEDAE